MDKIILTKHQQGVYDKIIQELLSTKSSTNYDNIISLTGPAGVGKTTLVTEIISTLQRHNKDVIVTAPTHKAVKVIDDMIIKLSNNSKVESSTIHSFLKITLKTDFNTGIQQFMPDLFGDVKMNNTTDVLIIDESSMIGTDMFTHIYDALNEGKCDKILFVGDKYQLPPTEQNYINPIFDKLINYNLEEIVRQAQDNPIIKLCTEIRDRISNKSFIDIYTLISKHNSSNIIEFNKPMEFLKDFIEKEQWYTEDKLICAYTNKKVHKYNNVIRNKYLKDINIIPKDIKSTDIPYMSSHDMLVLQESVTRGKEIIYNNGDAVVVEDAKMSKDRNGVKFWNITTDKCVFKVIDINSEKDYTKALDDIINTAKAEKDSKHKKMLWMNYYAYKGMYTGVKFKFCSTIHKLQGSTTNDIYIDLEEIVRLYGHNELLSYNLLYVAVSRAKSKIKYLIF